MENESFLEKILSSSLAGDRNESEMKFNLFRKFFEIKLDENFQKEKVFLPLTHKLV